MTQSIEELRRFCFTALLMLLIFTAARPAVAAGELTGYVMIEGRYFPEDPLSSDQFTNLNFSLALEPEYYIDWADYTQRLTIVPFLRLDQNDRERSHADLRQFYWEKVSRIWEIRVGFQKFFWGVAESQHLVDILNQTDLVENLDTEDKLGQPAIDIAIINRWGTFDLYLMPFFRERTFPGRRGRLRTIPRIDTEQTVYESGAEEWHFDWAVRWSRPISILDVGVSHFAGTGRQPLFLPGVDENDQPVLVPFYEVINQTGLDVQATTGGWLWKLEMISNEGINPRFTALTGGFEYTLVGIFGSVFDLGLLTEYLFDDRGKKALTPFQDDVFVGGRFVFNDVQSTTVLSGAVVDLQTSTSLYLVEASRRLGERYTLNVEVRGFGNIDAQDPFNMAPQDPFNSFRNDTHLQIDLSRYF